MAKIAFLYPGQGAQTAGMGKDFYENSPCAKEIYDQASERLKLDLRKLCFEKNLQLNLTEYTQAAMVTTCLAMTCVIRQMGLNPNVMGGLSLGEYCAISAAGGMDVMDAIYLVRKRGQFMEAAVSAGTGAMIAVLGADKQTVESCTKEIKNVWIANDNCPRQMVLSGENNAVKRASKALREAGVGRVVPLNVSGPFHSPLMAPAASSLKAVLNGMHFTNLQIPYISNVTAHYVEDIGQTKGLLVEQMTKAVRWRESMERLIEDGTEIFIEIGPGKTLCGFMGRINPNVQMYHIGSWAEMEQVVAKLVGDKEV